MFNESCWRCRFLAQIPDVDASVDVPDVSGDVSVAAPDMSLPDVSGEASLPSVGGDPSVPQVSSTVNASHVKGMHRGYLFLSGGDSIFASSDGLHRKQLRTVRFSRVFRVPRMFFVIRREILFFCFWWGGCRAVRCGAVRWVFVCVF